MVAIKGLRTLALSAKDPEAAERFYTGVLGGKVVNRIEHPTEGGRMMRETFVEVGGFRVAIADASEGPLNGFPHFTVMASEFKPKEELLGDLKSEGATVESIRDHNDGKGYSCYVRDPEGNRFEVWVSSGS